MRTMVAMARSRTRSDCWEAWAARRYSALMDITHLRDGEFGIGAQDGLSFPLEASLASRSARKRAVLASLATDWATACCFARDVGVSRLEK